jgi:N-methylhydantoinase A/oxoprolinase/acetone carboxylase beta subunit
VGKAQTTPEDESLGFMTSARDALGYRELEVERAMPGIASGIYSGTAMINRRLERKGRRVGLILAGGMEDMLRLERGSRPTSATRTRTAFTSRGRLPVQLEARGADPGVRDRGGAARAPPGQDDRRSALKPPA